MSGLFDAATELLLGIFSIVIPLFSVIVLAILGWYLVWKLFLSRFRFVRELLGSMGETPTHTANAGDPNKASKLNKKLRRD